MQIFIGTNALLAHKIEMTAYELTFYLIMFLLLALVIFIYAIVILLIKRRSTININELTEFRG